jgi:ADP-heptose:LPS heptosyltransferase
MSTKSPGTTAQNLQERALVFFPGALGDFICFLPTLDALAETARVDLFARSEFADLLPESVRSCSLESCEVNRLFVPQADDEEKLRNFLAGYASVYSWMGSGHEDFVRRLQKFCCGRAHIFPFDSATTDKHQSDYYLSCLGIPAGKFLLPKIHPRPEFMAWSADYWARHGFAGRRVLILAPGSGAREKNWPVEAFAAVAEWWRNQGGEPLVVLGPAEEERGGFEVLLRNFKAVRNASLGNLAAVISRGDIFLGNDSGITHLAAALGIATAALFGPSNAKKWRPRGGRVLVIRRNVECSPCAGAVMKDCPHRSCLSALDTVQVIRQLQSLAPAGRLDKVGGRD